MDEIADFLCRIAGRVKRSFLIRRFFGFLKGQPDFGAPGLFIKPAGGGDPLILRDVPVCLFCLIRRFLGAVDILGQCRVSPFFLGKL